MKVLQVLFDLKNKNIDSFNRPINDKTYEETIVIDFAKNQSFNIDIKKFDYIQFNNPNFNCDKDILINTIKKMEVEQFTLEFGFEIFFLYHEINNLEIKFWVKKTFADSYFQAVIA